MPSAPRLSNPVEKLMRHKLPYPTHPTKVARQLLLVASALCALLLVPAMALAAPSARLLRVDPRAGQDNTNPELTTVIEVAQSKRVSEQIQECGPLRGNAQLDCMSAALEKPFALYSPFPFPQQQALFLVDIEGRDVPAKFVSTAKWGDSQQTPGVGTAWLILIDADARMKASFADAKQVAEKFIQSMGPNDIVDVMFFDDRQVVEDSKWLPSGQKTKALGVVGKVGSTFASSGRNRTLLTIIRNAATDGFKALGNVGEGVNIPLHQAMVVLSNGFGGTDPSTSGPGALQLAQYMTGGRFPEDNTALPKSPVPIISVYFPPVTFDEFKQNSQEFMQNMADTEIGGFFTVMRPGQGSRAQAIVNSVRTRFSKMHIVKWRVSCISPTATQSFKLLFNNVKPPILGDNSFKDVPIGIDPTRWPLDVNVQYTQDMAKRGDGVYPGGRFKVYGDFCWGGDATRAEVYFIPQGQALPNELTGTDVEQAKRAQQQLIAMGMKGTAVEANDSYVEFTAPDKDKLLHGSGSQAVVRLVIFDSKANRTSGVTNANVIQLKGTTKPLPLLLILGGAFGVVVVLLLLVVILKSGGGKKRGGAPPPAPVAAYGPPPGGYVPPGGGYGAPPVAGPPMGGGPPPGGMPPGHMAPPAPAAPMGYAAPVAHAAPVGHGSNPPGPEFMYGGPGQAAPAAGVAPAVFASPAPPNPYASSAASRATLQGSAGVFTIVPGVEMRAGRDGAQCGILLTEPRVSAIHASLKLENGQLLVRDENSNNGTLVNGNKLSPGVWAAIADGSMVRFGPVEFSTRLES